MGYSSPAKFYYVGFITNDKRYRLNEQYEWEEVIEEKEFKPFTFKKGISNREGY